MAVGVAEGTGDGVARVAVGHAVGMGEFSIVGVGETNTGVGVVCVLPRREGDGKTARVTVACGGATEAVGAGVFPAHAEPTSAKATSNE